jgi:hypothetical protein
LRKCQIADIFSTFVFLSLSHVCPSDNQINNFRQKQSKISRVSVQKMSALNDNDIYSQNYNSTSGALGAYKQFSSPYLNFDPSYLPQTQPEFIFLDGASKQRGRFELAFGQIGGSCMIGASVGGASGFYNGLKATTLAGQTGKLRRTQ